ncbi:MAG: type II secretion system F family protein [Solirubrobacterales bacterium]
MNGGHVLIAGISGVSAFSLAIGVATISQVRKPRQRDAVGRGRPRVSAAIRRVLLAIAQIAPTLVARAGRRDVDAAIAAAGLTGRIGSRDVAAARVLSVAVAALLVPRIVAMAPGRTLPLVLALWFWIAAELPLWWLRRTATRRGEAMRAALPDALELMRACLSAGLTLRRSLLLVGDHCSEPIASEFICIAAEMALGVSQTLALDGLAARNPLPETRALVSAMHQADRHGSPLAPVIAAQADEARRAHNRATIERAARAGPKIQLIVATTIVPAALIGLAAVVIAAIARGEMTFF